MSETKPLPVVKLRYRRFNHSAEECFANMALLWRHYGRPPRCAEADMPPSTIGKTTYQRRSGSWMRAVQAFATFSGVEVREIGPAMPRSAEAKRNGAGARPERSDPRGVPLSLRFKVLQRDRFKCTACGNTPAADPGCKLQVDHIEHWSRGGKAEIENLRTLCAACNLGRGARAEG